MWYDLSFTSYFHFIFSSVIKKFNKMLCANRWICNVVPQRAGVSHSSMLKSWCFLAVIFVDNSYSTSKYFVRHQNWHLNSSFAVNARPRKVDKESPFFLQLINLGTFDLRAQPEAELRKMSPYPFSISFSV